MSIFDLKDEFSQTNTSNLKFKTSSHTVVTEPLTAFKIYDAVRIQDCITLKKLDSIIVAKPCCIRNYNFNVGEQVLIPIGTASINVNYLNILNTIIVSKKENQFKKGYWDITLKYVFEYEIVFIDINGSIIGSVIANSVYTKKVTLFGAENIDVSICTDFTNTFSFGSKPFVLIESKAVILLADVNFHKNNYADINITIGLFSIIKLFRLVDLAVKSKKFYIPREYENNDLDPCKVFKKLKFPIDIFAPKQKHACDCCKAVYNKSAGQ